jgi:hypothetical protein
MALPTTTPTNLADFVLGELGDSDQTIWTQAEILTYIQRVLYDFKARTLITWKRLPLNDVAGVATYVMPLSYNFHQMDRAEYDFWPVTPTPARQLMAMNGRFETSGQRPLSYVMEGDGIATLRKVGVPPAATANKFMIEFFAVGDSIAADAAIEIPSRYLVYVSFGVKAKAYKRDGDGQSVKMSQFWESRYEDGIEMVRRRRERLAHRRIGNIGNDGKVPESYRVRDPGTLPPYFPKIE